MNRTTINSNITRLIFGALALSAALSFGQDQAPAQQAAQPPAASPKEQARARRQAMQKLTTDFAAAVKSANLADADRQKAEAAIANLQPAAKGAQRDPKARQEALKYVRVMSRSQSFSEQDRTLLAQDLATVQSLRKPKAQ